MNLKVLLNIIKQLFCKTLDYRFLLFLLLFFSLLPSSLHAQKKTISVITNEKNALFYKNEPLFFDDKKMNIKQVKRKFEKLSQHYKSSGYLNFALDTLIEKIDSIIAIVYQGSQYKNSYISIADSDKFKFNEAHLNKYLHENKIDFIDYKFVTENLLDYFSNNGYPFAILKLDSVLSEKGNISAKLIIDRGDRFVYDSIVLQGDVKLSVNFLRAYLGFKKNRAYNERKVSQIPQLMSELPFLTESRPSGLVFSENKTILYLFCTKRKINQFDGYLGLVPKNSKTGKISLAGEINLNLRNLFTIGESLALSWKSEDALSQNLNISAAFPYLLRTPIGIEGSFSLEKADTSYLNIDYNLGLQYSFLGNNFIQTYFGYSASNILNNESSIYTNSDLLYADYKKTSYGLQLNLKKLDYIYNPRKGYRVALDIGVSNRNIINNSVETSSEHDYLYQPSTQYQIVGEAFGYIPLHKSWVIVIGAKGATLAGNNLLTNELFRIGGLYSLRGFDERSIYASSYLFGEVELRFLFAKMSFINLFFNGGWYEKNITTSYLQDYPFGFGIGVSFDTKAGIFYLSYALGKQLDNPISFQNGKIHFGITVNF